MSTKGQGRKSKSEKPNSSLSAMINQSPDYSVKLRLYRPSKHAKAKQLQVKK
jgi:hypothetical protein